MKNSIEGDNARIGKFNRRGRQGGDREDKLCQLGIIKIVYFSVYGLGFANELGKISTTQLLLVLLCALAQDWGEKIEIKSSKMKSANSTIKCHCMKNSILAT